MRRHLPLATVFLGAIAMACIPFAFLWHSAGSPLPHILPTLQSDTAYYLAQIHDVLDGHIWLGNPFLQEYASERSPTLVLPVWLAALPGLFTQNINLIFLLNTFVYSVLTALLLFAVHKRIAPNKVWLAACTALLGIAYVHNLIMRPAVMQTIYPLFLLFILSFERMLTEPKRTLWYGTTAAIAIVSFYLYLYLWMILFAALGIHTLVSVFKKDRDSLLRMLVVWVGIVLFCIPEILHIAHSLSDPLSQETSMRVGLISTHIIQWVTVLNSKYTIVVVLILAVYAWKHRSLTTMEYILLLLALGILAATFSNVITGKDMELHTHPWRFGLLLNAMALCWALATFKTKPLSILQIGCGTLLAVTIVSHVFLRPKSFAYLRNWNNGSVSDSYKELQEYAQLMDFLNTMSEPHVIAASEDISTLVPIYTHHSVVFNRYAPLHLATDTELQTRFLLQTAGTATEEFIRSEFRRFTGPGPFRLAEAHGGSALDAVGGEVFLVKADEELKSIQNDVRSVLDSFNVSLVIIDTKSQENPMAPDRTVIYHDERFTVYER